MMMKKILMQRGKRKDEARMKRQKEGPTMIHQEDRPPVNSKRLCEPK